LSSLRWRRARGLALATLAVTAVHAALLHGWVPAAIEPDPAPLPGATVLAVRSVALPMPVVAPVPVPTEPATPPAAPRRPASRPAPAPEPIAKVELVPPVAAEAPPARSTDNAELPLYATRIPLAGTWRYVLERGPASGHAILAWQPAPDGTYRLGLEGFIAGANVLDWVSAGRLDAHGLAPERFATRRRGRDAQAANFQRDAGIVTWSGPAHEIALQAGMQDRLSWLVQVPAIVEAQPERFVAGTRVSVMVIGARGGADLWGFSVMGHDAVGDVPALKLVRDARRPRETQVELWLDPARGHLPLRARLSQPEGGAVMELRLEASTGP
jgi:hypothetical protein